MRHRKFPLSHLAARCRRGLGPRTRIHHRRLPIRTAWVEWLALFGMPIAGAPRLQRGLQPFEGWRQPFASGGLRLPGGLSRSSIGCCRQVGRCGRVRWWARGAGRSQGCAERTSKRLDLDGVVVQQNRRRFGDQPDLGCRLRSARPSCRCRRRSADVAASAVEQDGRTWCRSNAIPMRRRRDWPGFRRASRNRVNLTTEMEEVIGGQESDSN